MITSANLGALFDRQGDPDQLAFIGLDDAFREQRITFGELDALAGRVAAVLCATPEQGGIGLQRGERVAILAVNSIRYAAAALGIMRAGGVVVPVNFKFPRALTDFVIQDSGARLVFCDEARRDVVPAGIPRIVFDEHDSLAKQHKGKHDARGAGTAAVSVAAHGVAPSFDAFVARHPADVAFETVEPVGDEVAMILYTSGSTGRPKGVLLSHASHAWVVRTRMVDTPLANERVLIAAPLYHMNALALMLLTVASHATAVLLPQFTARHYIEAISYYRCTWLTSVPPMIAMMLREKDALAQADLSSVRAVRMGSAPVSESLLERIHELLPNARVINAYGTTEGGPIVFARAADGRPTPPMALGVPHRDVAIRLRPSAGDAAPGDGAEGDASTKASHALDAGPDRGVLEMRSPALMLGYHQRPDIPLPFTEDGFYISGDVFRRDAEGFYYFVGRHDDMFVSGGENIFPGEVERMLEQHPAVQQASVVGIADEIKGTKPVAFIVLRAHAGANVDEAEIKRYALEHAPAYQHPRHVWFVDALPLASTNKIDRRALLDDATRRLNAAAN